MFTHQTKLSAQETTFFGVLAAMMFVSRNVAPIPIPNVHLLGLFIAVSTLLFRMKALIPLYLWILMEGIFAGFNIWWIPHLYIWLPLWGMFMVAGKINMPTKVKAFVYPLISGLHGLSFGILYAPAQAYFFKLSFQGMITWVAAGIPFDIIHATGNFAAGTLILPATIAIKKARLVKGV